MQWRKFTRLKTSATGHSRCKAMLCCGRRKDNGRSVPDLTASPGRCPPPGPMPSNQHNSNMQRQGGGGGGGQKEPVMLQGDFRKVSGISSEIFRQIEAVENDHDPSTAAALDAVERRGEMIVRVLEPRCIGSRQAVESAQRFLAKADARHTVQLVEIVKRPGQTLGLYIREGNGADRSDGVFISRIALESAVYNSGFLRVSDEILAVNLVDVTKMSLDDVVIIMSIPRRLVLAIRTRRGGRGGSNSPGPAPLSRPEQKPPPVVVIKRDLGRDEMDMMDEPDRAPRSRSSRDRRTGDGREMTESRSRLGLGLTNYSPQSEQLDLYYNNRQNNVETPNWGYKAPPPPSSVITEQPKGAHQFQPSHAYYQNAGTLESLAEKVHSFYPGPSRRMSAGTGTGVAMSQSHQRFPRSGSDQHLPRVEYSDYSSSLGRHSLLRSSLKSAAPIAGGTLGRYGRYDQPPSRNQMKYSSPASSTMQRRSRPPLDYSSDTEATIGPRPSHYYYNNQQQQGRPTINTLGRQAGGSIGTAALGGGPDFAKFNSLPRDRPSAASARLNLRSRLVGQMGGDDDGNLSAPEYSLPTGRRDRDARGKFPTNPSIFTSDEYRAWLRRAPSSSAICEQMRASRDILNQQRAHRFSCSAENIHDVLKNTENIYSSRTGMVGTLDRNSIGMSARGIASLPVRSMSSQHIGGPGAAALRSPNIRRMRQLLELSAGVQSPGSVSGMSGHQSPAPTPSTTLPRNHRQIDINPAEFSKYKLDKPIMEAQGVSGMLWLNLLAGRGLRATPEGVQTNTQIRDLYCVLECDRIHKARTVVRSGDLQFDWDESFELDLVNNKQLDVLVYSWDPQHRHKLCYRGAIAITSLIRQAPIHQLALKVEPRGTIYLRLRYTDPTQLYRRRGLPTLRAGAAAGLFGVDLETVVTREAKGAPGSAPVPIVLRRCVEEVERRGLDIIGLYRLCGSATKKRLLREAFERNSRAVELSPEHVPDINVITGVLKDYLRELPEPLFTRCLFQMTVDALGVCLPDDPEGNAKLMLSILDCLPRANRATLVFLLDHLSLVVSASERNKMSAQALATALGPPLMLHSTTAPSEEVDHAQPIAVLKYLLQIWPQPQSVNVSGRRGEPTGQRGNKANVLPAVKVNPVVNITPSLGRTPLLATANTLQYQSVVGQLAQSHRVLQPVAQQPLQLGASLGSVERVPSQQQPLATPSPSSSSGTTSSDSGSGTDTIKRGASPSASITSSSTARLKESASSNSLRLQALSITDEKINKINSYLKNDIKDEDLKKLTENNARGPKSIQSSDIAARSVLFSSDLLSSTSSYKESSLTNIKSSAMDLVNSTTNTVNSSDSKTDRKDDNISLYKPYAFPLTTSNSSTPYSSAHLNSLLRNNNNSKTTTATTIASSSVPSTSTTYETKGYTLGSYQFPSTTKSPTTTSSSSLSASSTASAISSSGLTTTTTATTIATTTAFTSSNKYEDSPVSSSVTTAYSSTLSKLSSATSSPSRTIINTNNNNNNTSTLPLNIGRNNTLLYQSESNYNTTTNTTTTNTTTTSYTSPVVCSAITSTSNGSSYLSQGQSSYSNIYGTLPKTSSNSYSSKYDLGDGNDNGSNSASKYSTNTYSSYKYNSDFSTNSYSASSSATPLVTSNTNGSSASASGAGNTNSLFRVQYSSTNPFLDAFDAPSATTANDANESASDNITALLRGNSSGISSAHINRFEKLDSEEDLK